MVTVSDAKEKEKQYVTAAGITVVEWRPCQKGDSLQGFLTLQLPSGLTLHDCTYHQRPDGARWLGLPARQYTKQDGTTAWVRLVDFADKAAHARFQDLALSAVDRYFSEHPAQNAVVAANRSTDSTMITDTDLNF